MSKTILEVRVIAEGKDAGVLKELRKIYGDAEDLWVECAHHRPNSLLQLICTQRAELATDMWAKAVERTMRKLPKITGYEEPKCTRK